MEVEGALRGRPREEPTQRYEAPALDLDEALGNAEDLRDPRRLHVALGVGHAALRAANEVSEEGGDEAATDAPRNEADNRSGHGHESSVAGEVSQGGSERFGHKMKLTWLGGKRAGGRADVAEQPDG